MNKHVLILIVLLATMLAVWCTGLQGINIKKRVPLRKKSFLRIQ